MPAAVGITPDEELVDRTVVGAFHAAPAARLLAVPRIRRTPPPHLVAGVTDKAIATQLRISQRTVQRGISDLMRRANTRMRLAWEVSRQAGPSPHLPR
jgi:hypothetical protein